MVGTLNLVGSLTLRTVGGVVAEARAMLNDPAPSTGVSYSGTAVTRTLGMLVADVRTLLADRSAPSVANNTRTLGMLALEIRSLLADPAPSTGTSFSGTDVGGRTLGMCVSEVRGQLNDTVVPYRVSDADLYIYLNDALLQARRFRPDLFVMGFTGGLPLYLPANAGLPFPVAEEYFPAFVQYVVASAETRNDTYVTEGKATLMAQGFVNNLLRAPYRHSDEAIYRYISGTLLTLRRVRSDLFVAGSTMPAEYTPASIGVLFPVVEEIYPAVVQNCVGLAKERDEIYAMDPKGGPSVGQAMQAAFVAAVMKAPYRYSDADLYRYITLALLEVRRMRPDLFVTGFTGDLPAYDASASAVVFPIAEEYYPAFLAYVMGMAMRSDAAGDDRGKGALDEAMQKIMTAPRRYSDGFLYAHVNDALAETRRMRPDLLLGYGLRLALPVYTAADSATPFPIDETYYQAFVHYVVGRALARDMPISKDNPPGVYLALFATQLGGS